MGCAGSSSNDECGDNAILPWPDSGGGISFQKIQLSTLKNLYELKGAAAEIYFENGFNGSGFSGPVARPRLTRSGKVCVPTDAASSLALTTYGHMERIYLFDRELGIDQNLRWPRKVGLDVAIRTASGHSHNNAHYIPAADVMAVIPYNQTGLPLAINAGVLAHEHFHSHFQAKVSLVLNSILSFAPAVESFFYLGFNIKPVTENVDDLDITQMSSLNNFVLRGWNEGLADVYAAMYSGRSDFFADSLPAVASARNLEGDVRLFDSGEGLRQLASERRSPSFLVGWAYFQGANLARVLFQVAKLSGVLPKNFVRQIMQRLPAVVALLQTDYRQRVLDSEAILPVLLEGIEMSPVACDVVKKAASRTLVQERFQACLRPL